jgi:hypothetical protein
VPHLIERPILDAGLGESFLPDTFAEVAEVDDPAVRCGEDESAAQRSWKILKSRERDLLANAAVKRCRPQAAMAAPTAAPSA